MKYWNAARGHLFTSFSLEQYIVSMYFSSGSAVRNYFYDFWSALVCPYDAAQSTKDAVNSAKQHAEKAKKYEDDNMPNSAESEIKKIVPEL